MLKNLEAQKAQAKEKMNRMIDEYYEKYSERSNAPKFTIDVIEKLMLEQQAKVRETFDEINSELANSIAVACKKKCPECGGILRRTKRNEPVHIKTLSGELELTRDYYYCRDCGYSEAPLDDYLELTELLYKMTGGLTVEAAYYAQNQSSFSDASAMLEKALHMEINRETVRKVTEDIGRLVYESDTEKASHILENMHEIAECPAKEKKGTLYIMTDGAAVNTRVKDENGSTWRENKTVIAFTDKDTVKRKDGSNITVRKEYSAYTGSADRFKGYVLNTAINAGYGRTQEVVILGDGAARIRNMGNEIFPEAAQILDLFRLKENIYNYAKYKFSYNEKEYVPWAEAFIDKIEKGKAEEVLPLLPEGEKTPAGAVNLRTYITNKKAA